MKRCKGCKTMLVDGKCGTCLTCPHCKNYTPENNFCVNCGSGLVIRNNIKFVLRKGNEVLGEINTHLYDTGIRITDCPEELPPEVRMSVEGFLQGKQGLDSEGELRVRIQNMPLYRLKPIAFIR